MNCPTSCCRLSFSRLVRPMDQLLISGRRRRRRALSIHWHLHFDFLLVARAAAAHPLLSVLSSRPPSSNHVLPSLRLCYSTNRMMEVAALCSLPPLPASAAIASFAPLHLRPISFNPPSVTSFVTSLPLSSPLHSWAVLRLLASVRTPILRSLGEISHCSPLALSLPPSLARPIVLSSIWDLLTCAYHQYVSAVRPSVRLRHAFRAAAVLLGKQMLHTLSVDWQGGL